MADFIEQFRTGLAATRWYEYLAVLSGIISVFFSRRESVWVYPTGLVGTAVYIYISLEAQLPGEAAVNLYYTVMSIVGWVMWLKKDERNQKVLHITASAPRERAGHFAFFALVFTAAYFALLFLKKNFFEGAIPWADAFATATAFTGMWLMTKKKTDSWYWWIATNVSSVPLYFVKGYAVTAVYYVILLVMAIFGLSEWRKKEQNFLNAR